MINLLHYHIQIHVTKIKIKIPMVKNIAWGIHPRQSSFQRSIQKYPDVSKSVRKLKITILVFRKGTP